MTLPVHPDEQWTEIKLFAMFYDLFDHFHTNEFSTPDQNTKQTITYTIFTSPV